MHNISGDIDIPLIEADGLIENIDPVYSISGDVTIPLIEADGLIENIDPVYSISGDVTIPALQYSGFIENIDPLSNISGDLFVPAVYAQAEMEHVPPVFDVTLGGIMQPVQASGTSLFGFFSYEISGAIIIPAISSFAVLQSSTGSPIYEASRYTLSYSPENEGWPSFYEFYPEFMKGMNQRFYTFKGGNLYRHNEKSVPRNLFYAGHFDFQLRPSYIKTVMNDSSLETKNFKTVSLESTDRWTVSCFSELETGEIASSYFEKKEDSFYAYIRAIETLPIRLSDYALRSAQGVGVVQETDLSDFSAVLVTYGFRIDNIMSIGDILYQGDGIPEVVGPITAINRATNTITVNLNAFPTITTVVPAIGEYNMYSKNNVSESNGVRGSYLVLELTNSSTGPEEIFSIGSEVFKSYT